MSETKKIAEEKDITWIINFFANIFSTRFPELIEKRLHVQQDEFAVFWEEKTGIKTLFTSGNSNYIYFSNSQIEKILKLDYTTCFHNHTQKDTQDSRSFSIDDFKIAQRMNIKNFTLISYRHRFKLVIRCPNFPQVPDIESIYSSQFTELTDSHIHNDKFIKHLNHSHKCNIHYHQEVHSFKNPIKLFRISQN